jgi:hypothetical protein
MLESEWSDPQSGLTEELGLAPASAVAPNPSSLDCAAFDAPQRFRCVVPRVQPSQRNRSDQRVPVYWDQIVPVWRAGGASATAQAVRSHARELQGRSARRGECGPGGRAPSAGTVSVENSGGNCCCSSGIAAAAASLSSTSTPEPRFPPPPPLPPLTRSFSSSIQKQSSFTNNAILTT